MSWIRKVKYIMVLSIMLAVVFALYVNNGWMMPIDDCKELRFIGDGGSAKVILNRLFDKLTFGFGSVDLFVTQDDRWGILEHCNQFATEDYHPSFMSDFHRAQIDALLTKAGIIDNDTVS